MRRTALAAMAALLAATGCSTSAPSPRATVTVTATPAASSPAPSPQASSSLARANARLIVGALASGTSASISSVRNSVAGPMMTHYLRLQALEAEALDAAGTPEDAGSVTRIAGGYQNCYSGGQGCQSFTAFRSDAAGHITDLDVGGQPISARLAWGPAARGAGLVLTDVGSYLSTATGTVSIVFKVRSTGNQDVRTGSPPFLPVFVTSPGGAQLDYDDFNSVIPGPLQPGESAAVAAVFHTRVIAGQLSLRTNNGYERILVASTLRKPLA